eukprot:TRINITY_DN3719_c0_g1_i1.p1 TRINITY_DN3719_c0_g1~~TRINITY_DN3719_c0_g1_i1.p1  ORF type:complete len:775 (+),score=358.94 TRINITY_DN3719_c0_g1_i1:113-2437(+)
MAGNRTRRSTGAKKEATESPKLKKEIKKDEKDEEKSLDNSNNSPKSASKSMKMEEEEGKEEEKQVFGTKKSGRHASIQHNASIDEKDLAEEGEMDAPITLTEQDAEEISIAEEEEASETPQEKRKREKEARDLEKKVFNEEMKAKAMVRLKFLLEKTSLYSSFLSQKVSLPTSSVVEPEKEEKNEEGEGNELEDSKKRKRVQKSNGKAKKTVKKEEEKEEKEEEAKGLNNVELAEREQPSLVTGAEMRGYQKQGVGWLISLYENGLNGILADEMGLGKTLQCIGLFAHLVENGVKGPFLVVAPLSTISNWIREINRFTPSISCLMYHGPKEVREQLRNAHFRSGKGKSLPSIIVTSYQITMIDRKFLSKIQWKYIVVDEGHRLKNLNCKLVQELKSYHSANRLLLTGTPLQNNLLELWSMLNFLLPDIFDDVQSFQSLFDFSDAINNKEGSKRIIEEEERDQIIGKLHTILRPFLLRRVKADVKLGLPSKHEKVVYIPLSDLQKSYYKAIVAKNLEELLSEKARKQIKNSGSSLQNILMQLRKVCNHPYLFEWPEDQNGEDIIDENLVKSSEKLGLLDRMLPKLKKEGHRILIFSQMTRMLDILEDYLTFRKHSYFRIDGTTPQPEREEQIQQYNTSQDCFVFLLSTRAGGLGINLTGADTVIFYDNDWNPQMDLQAQDRAHRIGQTKPVKVYRFASSNSIESTILDRQDLKMKLTTLVIQKGNFQGVKSQSAIKDISELEALLTKDLGNLGQIDKEITDKFLFGWSDSELRNV